MSKYNKYKKKLFNDAKGLCQYCGEELSMNDTYNVTIDHVTPQHLGGKSDYNNLRICCKKCNSQKRHRDIETFRRIKISKINNIPSFSKEQKEYLKDNCNLNIDNYINNFGYLFEFERIK